MKALDPELRRFLEASDSDEAAQARRWKFRVLGLRGEVSPGHLVTWTPNVCKIMAFTAVILGLGLLFCILLGFR